MKRSTGRSDEPGGDAPVAYEIVVLGTSWGGLAAARTIVRALPAGFELPVILVQHRHRDSDAMLARFLQDHTPLRVCEPDDKQPIEGQSVYVAPANYHLLVDRGQFTLSVDDPVRYSRPSIDMAFASAADAYGRRAVGVVLTGANADGAEGLKRLFTAGGLAVVQDPATAEVDTMPLAALRWVPRARVLPLDRIGPFLSSLPFARATEAP